MRTAPLPVRPKPGTREPLSRYAVRLAMANGVIPSRLLPPWRQDIDVPKDELATVAALGRLQPAETARMTMDRYPLAIRGHGAQHRHGWRLHYSARWICPTCTVSTGHCDLLWQTALMPVCLRCDCYLVATTTSRAVPAPPVVLDLVESLVGLAEASIGEPGPRKVLYRLRRRCLRLATTAPLDQLDLGFDLPPVDLLAARSWGAYPSPDPGTVAALLVLTGTRLGSRKRSQPVHPRPRPVVLFSESDRDRLEWFVARLRHHVGHDALRPEHVPSMLPAAATVPPRGPGAWLSPTRAAVALHMLISSVTDQEISPAASMEALGVPDIPTSALIDGVHAGMGLREHDHDLLLAALDVLVADGLVDYQRRRDTLRALTRLPADITRRLPVRVTDRPDFVPLALGWIWTRFTHGPMRSSPWPTIPDRDIHAFDNQIDPETRLVLLEAGEQLLATTTDLTEVPATAITQSAASRRHG